MNLQPDSVNSTNLPPRECNRRTFSKQFVTLTATSTLLTGLGTASEVMGEANDQRPTQKNSPMASEVPATSEENSDEQSDKQSAEKVDSSAISLSAEEIILQSILKRYPSARLTIEIQQEILRDIQADLARSAFLSHYPLKNSDEPATIFQPYRSTPPT